MKIKDFVYFCFMETVTILLFMVPGSVWFLVTVRRKEGFYDEPLESLWEGVNNWQFFSLKLIFWLGIIAVGVLAVLA